MRVIKTLCSILLVTLTLVAQSNQPKRVLIKVIDGHQHEQPGISLRMKPNGVISEPTDRDGLTWIDVPPNTKAGPISIEIVNQGRQDWLRVAPDDTIPVTSFHNTIPIPIVVIRRGDPEILVNGEVLLTSTARIIRSLKPYDLKRYLSPTQRRAVLASEARRLGVAPEDLDKAIRAWIEHLNDPYEKALGALYKERFTEAEGLLKSAYEAAHKHVYEVDINYGLVEFNLGHYVQSDKFLQEALNERPDDYGTMNDLGMVKLHLAQYADAEKLLRSSLSLMKTFLSPDDLEIVHTTENIAALLREKNDNDGARQQLDEAGSILKNGSVVSSGEIAQLRNDYGTIYQAENKYMEADADYTQAVSIFAGLATERFSYAVVLTNRASERREAGRFNDAIADYEAALTVLNSLVASHTIDANHPFFGDLHSGYGLVFSFQQQYERAEEHYLIAKAILAKSPGEEHPNFARVLVNLSESLFHRQQFDSALELLQQALRIEENALGKNHPAVAEVEITLGYVLVKKNRFAEAESHINRAIALLKDRPQSVVYLSAAYTNLGGLYTDLKRLDKQAEYFQKARELLEPVKRQRPMEYSGSLVNLAAFYTRTKRFSDAEPLLIEALTIRENIPGVASRAIAEVLGPYGLMYAMQGKLDQALPHWERSLRLTDHPPDSLLLANSLNNLGELYRQLGRLQDAEVLLRRAYEMWPRIGLGETPQMLATCKHYADLLRQVGKDPSAPEECKRGLELRLQP